MTGAARLQPGGGVARAFERARSGLTRLSRLFAAVGGLCLTAAALFTVGAVLSAAGGAPLLGDTEIVELLAGAAVASFMPYCQMLSGHVAITVFTDRAPEGLRRAFDALAAVLFAALVLVLVWRMTLGAIDSFNRGRISMFLELPQWWGYAVALPSAVLWAAASVFVAAERLLVGAPNAAEADAPEEAGL